MPMGRLKSSLERLLFGQMICLTHAVTLQDMIPNTWKQRPLILKLEKSALQVHKAKRVIVDIILRRAIIKIWKL